MNTKNTVYLIHTTVGEVRLALAPVIPKEIAGIVDAKQHIVIRAQATKDTITVFEHVSTDSSISRHLRDKNHTVILGVIRSTKRRCEENGILARTYGGNTILVRALIYRDKGYPIVSSDIRYLWRNMTKSERSDIYNTTTHTMATEHVINIKAKDLVQQSARFVHSISPCTLNSIGCDAIIRPVITFNEHQQRLFSTLSTSHSVAECVKSHDILLTLRKIQDLVIKQNNVISKEQLWAVRAGLFSHHGIHAAYTDSRYVWDIIPQLERDSSIKFASTHDHEIAGRRADRLIIDDCVAESRFSDTAAIKSIMNRRPFYDFDPSMMSKPIDMKAVWPDRTKRAISDTSQEMDLSALEERMRAFFNESLTQLQENLMRASYEVNETPKSDYHDGASAAGPLTQPLYGDPMKNFDKRTLIRGNDADNMSDDQILTVITDIEGQITALEAINTPTQTVKNKVKSLKKDIGRIVKHLDRNCKDDSEA